MRLDLEQITSAALSLSLEARAQLAERLLTSLDDDPEITAAWMEEAKRRMAEIDAGTVTTIPSEEVFARLRSKLQG
jgi:putative addiction module component (TIGR02574 family)